MRLAGIARFATWPPLLANQGGALKSRDFAPNSNSNPSLNIFSEKKVGGALA
jgi:hypothetical protein